MSESQNMPQIPKPSLYEAVDLMSLSAFPHGLQPRFALPPVSKYANISFTEAFRNKDSEGAQQVVLELQAYKPSIDKRTNHAIQYLKRKGLYHTNMYDILEKHCQDIGVDTTTAMLTSIVDGLCEYASRREVTQETYEKAIELTMVQCELDKFIEPDLYSRFLQPHIGILYANVILIAYANEVAQKADKLDDHVQFIAKWIREGHKTEELLKIMQDGNSRSL